MFTTTYTHLLNTLFPRRYFKPMLRRIPALYFKNLAVWGGGTMGGGIAQVAATAGVKTTVVDITPERLDISRKAIETSLSRIAKKKCNGDAAKMKQYVDEVISRMTWTTDDAMAAGRADLIIEAIVENIDAKKELFAKLDKLAPKETVFSSNTSSLLITDMASDSTRADRFVGTHFFSPVPMMQLVEVVQTDKVDDKLIAQLKEFVKKIGKVPVVTKDTKGFIVNRLLVPYQLEANRLVERGVATFEDVDIAMRLGCGYPMGPFELADSVGMDVGCLILKGWHEDEPENPVYTPSKLIENKVKTGKLGKKTGEGFYKYDAKGHKIE